MNADTLQEWADLLATAARHFNAVASDAAPGSPEYLTSAEAQAVSVKVSVNGAVMSPQRAQ